MAMVYRESGHFGGALFAMPLVVIPSIMLTVIAGLTTFFPYLTYKKVFCEFCDCWCEQKLGLARFCDTLTPGQADRLKDGDMIVLAELPLYPAKVPPYLRLDSHHCNQCKETVVFQVKRVTFIGQHGPYERTRKITPPIMMTVDALEQFNAAQRENATRAAPAAAPVSSSPETMKGPPVA